MNPTPGNPSANPTAGNRTVFVTGTDTGVGKTMISQAILEGWRCRGLRVAGFKPVASGAELTPDGLRNADGLALLAASTPGLDYAQVNPYCLAPAIAPHLAAAEAGRRLDPAVLDRAHAVLERGHDRVLVEGAGGWLVPLNEAFSFADWVSAHRWPVLLVVAMRLGCINHALLSAEAIVRRTPFAGWVANVVPEPGSGPMARLDANIDSLRARMPAPLLGIIQPILLRGASRELVGVDLAGPDGLLETAFFAPVSIGT